MKDAIFADGIIDVGFVGGAVRVHLGVYRPSGQDPNSKPVLEEAGCVIMTPEGFVALFNGLQAVVARFEQAGIMKKQAPAPVANA